jgi:ubiquinone/menaquinone biosynthesis C-methylase UbiE
MDPEPKLKPMSNLSFRLMTWTMAIEDLFKNPAKLLKDAPLKEGMVVVDYACGPGRYAIPAAESVGPSGKVYAVDSQPLALATVKRKAEPDC